MKNIISEVLNEKLDVDKEKFTKQRLELKKKFSEYGTD